MFKRSFDIIISLLGLLFAGPVLLVFAIWIKLDSKGPIFFRQRRVTKGGKIFLIHKFRSMKADQKGSNLTSGDSDSRVTRVGKVIRKLHIDEIVQLIDVLKGDMSVVGPRPEVEEYIKYYPEMWEKVLSVNSGITGLASIKYAKTEYEILAKAQDKSDAYIKHVLPTKLRYEIFYINKQNIIFDLKLIWWTVKYFLRAF